MWRKLLDWILARLNESTTYVAFFNFLAVIIGINVNPELQTIITNLCLAIDALILFLINEHKKEKQELEYLKERLKYAKGEKDLERLKDIFIND